MRRKESWGVSAFKKLNNRNLRSFFFILSLFAAGTLSAQTLQICSGASFNYTNGAPSGTTFTWTITTPNANLSNVNPNTSGTQLSFNDQGTPYVNNTTSPQDVVLQVNASDPIYSTTLTVRVIPTPTLTSVTTTAVCSGSAFSFPLTASTGGSTTITWVRTVANSVGVAPTSSSGTGALISEASLTNTTPSSPASIVYTVTLSATGCSNVQPFNVTVNPLPTLNTTTIPDVCSNATAILFTATSSQSPNVTFTWSRGVVAGNAASSGSGPGINEILTNVTASPVAVTYNYALHNTVTGCDNTVSVTTNVKPVPSLSNLASAPSSVCSGQSVVFNATSSLAATSFNYTRGATPNINPNSVNSNSASLNETITNSSNAPITVHYLFTLSKANCSVVEDIPVTVNPLPTLSTTLTPTGTCSASTFNYTPNSSQAPNVSYAWTRAANTAINGNTTTNGTNGISEALTNSTNATTTVFYTYTLTNSITGCINTQNVALDIYPTPVITGYSLSVCNQNGFVSIPPTAPVGTTFTWPAPVVSNPLLTGVNPQPTAVPYVNESLFINNGPSATATYHVTPTLGGCAGGVFDIVVTVGTNGPTTIDMTSTAGTLSPPAICSGTLFNFQATSTSAISFSWQRLAVAGIVEAGTQSSSAYVNETLTNSTTGLVTTYYYYTVTAANGCTNAYVVNTQINPGTSLSSTLTPTPVCSNTPFNYTATSNTAGTSFTWTRAVLPGISNAVNNGNGTITESLINTTDAPITVAYQFNMQTGASPACTNTQTVNVIVNPSPKLSSGLTIAAVCSGTPITYTATSNTSGAIFNWSRPAATNITTPPFSGITSINETLNNPSLVPATVQYTFSITANGCSNVQTVTGTVNPIPSVNNMTATICSGTGFSGLAPLIPFVPSGTQYIWSFNGGVVTGGTSSATPQSNISEMLSNVTATSAVATYTVTPTASGCAGNSFVVDVTVNPIPSVVSQTIPAICSGTAFTFTPTSIPSGTTYTWAAAPSIAPASAISGGTAAFTTTTISQTLANLTTNSASAEYTIIPTANSCVGNAFTLTVPVNPVPTISGSQVASICSAGSFTVTPSGVPSGTTYTWAAPSNNPAISVVGASAQSTPQPNISQTLTSPLASVVTTTYTVSPVSGSCAGTSFPVVVTINPSTQLNSTLTPSAICSGGTFSYIPTSATSGTSFSWLRTAIAGISNPTNSGSANNGNPLETLSNGTAAPITVNYQYSLVTAAGCTNAQTVTVVVNPTPTLSSALSPFTVCSGNAFAYTPASATSGTTFSWNRNTVAGINPNGTGNTGPVNETLVNTTLTGITVPYAYTLTANGCSNTQQVTVMVNPVPVANSQALSICSNTTFAVSPTGVPSNTQYTWGNPVSNPASVVTGGSSQGTPQANISQALFNVTTAPGDLTYSVLPTASGCAGNGFTITVTVNPVPTVGSNVFLSAVCSGNAFSYIPPGLPSVTTYSWTNPAQQAGISGGFSMALQPSVSQTLSNSTLVAANAVYTVTPRAYGCAGATFDITVPVNPVPNVANQSVDICSGFAFTVSPTNVPSGTTYTWGTPVTNPFGAVTGASAQLSAAGNISQTLTSSSTSAVQTYYSVIPATSSCTGNAFTITVGVNAGTSLSTSLTPPAICSNTTFSYAAASNTPTTTVFNWSRVAVAGISNTTSSGSGNPNETLVNTTASPLSVVYSYTLSTTAGCNNTQSVTVVVNPTPKLNPQTINAICSGQANFTYNPISATSGTTFTWNRAALTGISNAQASGTGDPNEPLVNTTLNTIPVTYVYTLAANGCSNTESVVVNVNPVPVVSDLTAVICSRETFTVTPANVPSTTRYTWAAAVSNPANVVTGGTAGTLQNNITGTLTNATISRATGLFTVTPVAGGCSGNAFSVTVTVNPIPVAASQTITAVCSGVAFDYTPANVPVNTKYSWGAPAVTPLQGLTGGSAASVQNSVSQTLISTNNIANTAVYIVTPVADGCTGSTFQVTVPVNPVPVVANQSLAICSGNAFNVTPTSVPVGTQYTWTMPVYTPNGSVTGGSPEAIPKSFISQNLTNTTTAAVQSVYTVTPGVNGCFGNPFTITVGVNPGTQLNLSAIAPAICSNNQFSYAAASNTPGTSFQWTRAVVAGISNPAASGINNPLETLNNITSQPITVTYTYVLTTPAGCADNETVSVRVNPTPQLTSPINPSAICSGAQFNYTPASTLSGTAFAWTRDPVAFITNTAASGVGNPAEVLVSTSTGSVSTYYDYTLTANSCASTTRITVVINPTPTIANQTLATCSNVAFNYSPTNVPLNTLYSWSAPALNPAGSMSGATAAADQPGVSQLLINQTLNTALARYTVTPAAAGCVGASFFVDVTVNPAASIGNQTLASVCSGTTFSYTPSNVPSNTVYTWANPVITGTLTGGSAEAVSKQSISQTLSSNNNLVNNAVYTVTPSTNGCLGQPFNLTVFVKPTPSVTNMKDTICTGSSFSLTASPVPASTMYTWTAPLVFPFGAVVGQTSQPTQAPSISQTLFNTTNAAAQVVYTVTPIADGCVGNNFTLAVVVGANMPTIPNQTTTVCSGATFNATPANMLANTTYTWNSPTITPANSIGGASAANLPQTAVSQLLDNLTTARSTVVYTVSAKNNGCVSNNFTATVTVLPVPRTFVTGNTTICRYPFDTLTITFTGDAPYGFTYYDGTSSAPHVLSNIPSSPYQLILPASPQSSRKLSFLTATNNGCVNNKDTTYFEQVINSLPVGVLHSLHGPYICNNIMDTMFVTSPESLTYQWMRNGAALAGATDDSIATNVAGRYNVMMTNQFGCRDTAAVFDTKVYVPQPVLRLKYDTYCINTLMNFTNMTDTNLVGPTAWKWTFDNGTTAGTFHASTSFATGGDHHINLKATQLYCPAYPTTIDTTVNINFPIPGVTMPSMSAYKGQSTPVSVRNLPGYRYRWTPPFGINNPDASSTTFNNQTTQQYVINLISPAGCVTQDSLLVRVFDDKLVEIFIPKSFTPNGDGINDILYPYLSGIKEFKYFKVYNRFNQLMFETRNHDAGWNGTVNGTPQPMAIYIWVAVGIANDGSTVERKGQVLLLR